MLKEDILLNLLRFLNKGLSFSHTRRLLRMRKDTFTILVKEAVELGYLIKKNNHFQLSKRGLTAVQKNKPYFLDVDVILELKFPKKFFLKPKNIAN